MGVRVRVRSQEYRLEDSEAESPDEVTERPDEVGPDEPEEVREPLTEEDRLSQWRADVLNSRKVEQKYRIGVNQLEDELSVLKGKLKVAREEWEHAVRSLGSAIDSLDRPMNMRPMPLFDQVRDEEPAKSDAWKDVLIDELKLTEAQTRRLFEADVRTLGDLQGHLDALGRSGIKGLGDKAWTKIEDAVDKFWEMHPELYRPDQGSEEEEAEDKESEPEDEDWEDDEPEDA